MACSGPNLPRRPSTGPSDHHVLAETSRLAEVERLLTVNGGRIVKTIKDPKLTHIVMDDDDSCRYAGLIRTTAE